MTKLISLLLVGILIATAGLLPGCKKKSVETEQAEVKTVTETESKAQIEKEITTKNMEAELEKLEKQVEQDIQQEQ